MKPIDKTLLLATTLACATPTLDAQQHQGGEHETPPAAQENLAPPPTSAISETTGLTRVGSDWHGGGRDWEARFEHDRVRFFPVLPNAPETAELSWTTIGVSRGSGSPTALPNAQRTGLESDNARAVHYRRGSVTETYEIRTDGMKQSFVFDQLPAGSGDLVVHGTIESVLPFLEQNADGLRFEQADVGAVTFGNVTGFDAAGRSVSGSIEFDGKVAALRLPGEWIQQATLPIMLDPFVSTTQVLGASTSWNERTPAIGYDPSSDQYLAVWSRAFSSQQVKIRGQRLDSLGNPTGGTVFVSITLGLHIQARPDVARISMGSGTTGYAVVWEQDGDIRCTAITSSGSRTSESIVANTSSLETHPGVIGVSGPGTNAYIVYDDSARGIRGKPVQLLTSSSDVSAADLEVSGSSGSPNYPSLAKNVSSSAVVLVVWNEGSYLSNTVRANCIQFNTGSSGLRITASNTLTVASGGDNDLPRAASGRVGWIVAWEHEPFANSGDNDVRARAIHVLPPPNPPPPLLPPLLTIGFYAGEQVIASDPNDDERGVDIAHFGYSAIVTWQDRVTPTGTDYDLFARQIDGLTAEPIAFQTLIAGGNELQQNARIGEGKVRDVAGVPDEEAVVVWQGSFPTQDVVRSRRWINTRDGVHRRIPGTQYRCNGTYFDIGATKIGHDCLIRLDRAPANTNHFLLFSGRRADASCSTQVCRIVPDLATGVSIPAPTNNVGTAQLTLPIPNDTSLQGVKFFSQWLRVTPGSTFCHPGGLSPTQAGEFTIQ